eukprot:496926-Prymnesium_polylepis.2
MVAKVVLSEHTTAQCKRALPTPYFQAGVATARHDPRAVGREAHGPHVTTVSAWLLRHQRHV